MEARKHGSTARQASQPKASPRNHESHESRKRTIRLRVFVATLLTPALTERNLLLKKTYEHGALSRGHRPATPPRPLGRPRPDRDRHGQEPRQATPPVPELFVLPARPGVPAAPHRREASGGGRVH